MFLQNTQDPPDRLGRLYNDHEIEILSSTQVRVTTNAPVKQVAVYDVVMGNGITTAVPLTGSGYNVLLGTNQVGARWITMFYTRPAFSLGEISATFRSIGEPTLLSLFGASPTEPYKTFRNLWRDNRETPNALAGILLAVIYRTEEVRQNG